MRDYGLTATEQEVKRIERKIKDIYSQAEKEIDEKIADFVAKYEKKEAIHLQELKDGKITQLDFDDWKAGQVFQGKQWTAKKEQIADVLYNANTAALNIVNGGKISVFAENANWTAYDLEHTAGVDFGFGLYDSTTVTKMLKDDPEILPYKKLNKRKDTRWNFKNIKSQITQGIIQGEGIPQIAKRLSQATSSTNRSQMYRTARTAMTSAQNGGRLQRLKEASDKGIKLQKEWLATLDGRTRDEHRDLDGQKVPIDEPFKVGGREIEFPGDPHAHPSLTYNCRCTLLADLEDYPDDKYTQRRDQETGEPIADMTYREWEKSKKIIQ